MYLLIQSPGIAPVESFSLLGASSSRGTEKIGQFGTGAKHAINVLLRAGVKFRIYLGTDRIDFHVIDHPFKGQTVKKVQYSTNGKKPKDTGWTLEWGEKDWDECIDMALREFISNAIDECSDWEAAKDRGDLKVEASETLRAARGFTRIYVEMTSAVKLFFNQLDLWFLHWYDPELVNASILPKLEPNSPARVYRRGVFVRELPMERGISLYDYNLEINIDDCRNSSDSEAATQIAKAISNAPVRVKAEVLQSVLDNSKAFETSADEWYLTGRYSDRRAERRAEWQAAWGIVGGGVVCSSNSISEKALIDRGRTPTIVGRSAYRAVLKDAGVETSDDVLDIQFDPAPVPERFEEILREVWSWTGAEKPPKLACFYRAIDVEVSTYSNGTIYIHHEAADPHRELLKRSLEHVIKSTGTTALDYLTEVVGRVHNCL